MSNPDLHPQKKKSYSRLTGYIIGILIALLLTIILVELIMAPPAGDLINLAIYLGFTSLVSAAIGFLFARFGWWRKFPRLYYALILGYILAGGLTLLNVWVTARLMFINSHDFALGSLLLFFAGGISIAFGFFISKNITQALSDLVEGAQRMGEGDFSVRVPVEGQDEIAQLSRAFNEMADRLESAAEAEKALEVTRRNLVAWASHDLRTPLTSLRAMITALADGVVDDPQTTQRYLEQSQIEITRMSNFINDLFELAQLDAGYRELAFEWLSLSDLISDTLESFAVRANARKITLQGSVDPQVDPIWADPSKLSRILDNLISNALRYTAESGTIGIYASVEGAYTIVKIQDDGVGIPPEELPHIFDHFYRGEKSRSRTNDESGGVGLGLAIVKALVEAHHGKIWVESEPGKGTTFWFSLPRDSQAYADLNTSHA